MDYLLYIKPHINHRTLKCNYRTYIFDTRYQNNHRGPEIVQVNLTFAAAVKDVVGHALALN